MKKILACITVIMFLTMVPFVSFAKKVISESELDAVTAQEGVTLDFGGPSYTNGTVNVTNWAPSLFSWGDSDGFTGYTSYGWVGLSNIGMNADSAIILYNQMTIDVGSSGTVTKLNLGLPSVLVHPVLTNATMKLGTSKDLLTNPQIMGTIFNDKFAVIVNPLVSAGISGSLTIGNHSATNQQGIETTLTNIYLGIPSQAIIASWGDANGCPDCAGYTGAGYFGVKGYLGMNSAMGANAMILIQLSGSANIDVGTSGTRTVLDIVLPTTVMNANVGFGMANITAPLALGAQKDFSDNQQLLGTAYMEGFHPTVTGRFCMFAH